MKITPLLILCGSLACFSNVPSLRAVETSPDPSGAWSVEYQALAYGNSHYRVGSPDIVFSKDYDPGRYHDEKYIDSLKAEQNITVTYDPALDQVSLSGGGLDGTRTLIREEGNPSITWISEHPYTPATVTSTYHGCEVRSELYETVRTDDNGQTFVYTLVDEEFYDDSEACRSFLTDLPKYVDDASATAVLAGLLENDGIDTARLPDMTDSQEEIEFKLTKQGRAV